MVLLASLVLVLGPGGDFACLASDDAGTRAVQSPSALVAGFIPAQQADWKVYASIDRTRFGRSVASAGNVDGYYGDDVVVGAPYDGDESGEGVVYLFRSTGGGLEETPYWAGEGGSGGALFGSSVAGAGDVNNDTRDDVIIGAPDYKAELMTNDGLKEVKAGAAFVYLGDPGLGLISPPIWTYSGEVQDGKFGDVVSGAGDVNGDGIDDVVVGARWYTDQPATDPNKHSGAIYLFYGSEGSGPSAEPDWFVSSSQAGAWFGASVGSAGDVDHDGYDDLVVGAPGYLNPETGLREGAAFLFLGGDSPPAGVEDADWIVYGWQEDGDFGTVVAGAGDVNGDNHLDIVVSAPDYRRPSDDMLLGAVFAYCGNGSGLDIDPCWQVAGGQPGAQFGVSASGAGDVNGDGFDEVIVGAPSYTPDPEAGFEGAAFLYFGSEAGLSTWPRWKASGDRARTDFGWSVGSAGHVADSDGDGLIDDVDSVLIGAPQYYQESVPYGGAFAFYGPLEPAELYPAAYLPLVMSSVN